MPFFRRNSFRSPHAVLLAFALLLPLAGCMSSAVAPAIQRLPERVELSGVPFFAQTAYEGAPGALAILLSQQGVVTTPGLVAKKMQLPGSEARLQQNLQRVVNEYGLLVYPLEADLPELLAQVAAGFPVLVRINNGFGWVSSPRYAVLIGYDRAEQTLLLRSGRDRRLSMGFDNFESAWNALGHWAVLVQAPAQLPANVDRQRWLNGAAELEHAGQKLAASNAHRAIEPKSSTSQIKTAP